MRGLAASNIKLSGDFVYDLNGSKTEISARCLGAVNNFIAQFINEHSDVDWKPRGEVNISLYEYYKFGESMVCYTINSRTCNIYREHTHREFMSNNSKTVKAIKNIIKTFDSKGIAINKLDVRMIDGVLQYVKIV